MRSSQTRLDHHAPFPLLLAPMVGLTHFVVRKTLQEYLPPGRKALWPTEMLNSRRIPYQRAGQSIETRFDDFEAGLCPQLLGNEEGFIRDSISKLRDWGARAIDINMGCPVKRALRHNYGVALMGDPDYAAEITAIAVKYAGELPVSVKLRAAPPPGEARNDETPADPDPDFLKNFCLKIQAAGASWITLHPRTAAQRRKGTADWSQIASLKQVMSIPVIGNGDVQTLEDVERMFEQTGCDRIMIGRALLAKPWLLSEFGRRAPASGTFAAEDPIVSGASYGKFLSRVLELSREHYPEPLGVRRFRFLAYFGSPYLEYGHHFYSSLTSTDTYDGLSRRLLDFFGARFERPQKMASRTSLRY
ncbi:MAG: tRNA-dihydrouridine synthase family protein [Oligoflexia bacterium]|nr:tRNA-dihydrouridine synthase family protein [Oligoflexia bacterium]